jgi:hypothetical protein
MTHGPLFHGLCRRPNLNSRPVKAPGSRRSRPYACAEWGPRTHDRGLPRSGSLHSEVKLEGSERPRRSGSRARANTCGDCIGMVPRRRCEPDVSALRKVAPRFLRSLRVESAYCSSMKVDPTCQPSCQELQSYFTHRVRCLSDDSYVSPVLGVRSTAETHRSVSFSLNTCSVLRRASRRRRYR